MEPGSRKCALTALHAVACLTFATETARAALYAQLPATAPSITYFNDTHTHAEVLDLYDKAIAACDE